MARMETMARFNAGPEQIVWYNRQIAAAISDHRATVPVAELEEATTTLAHLLNVQA